MKDAFGPLCSLPTPGRCNMSSDETPRSEDRIALDKIRTLVKSGQKIEAIKVYREYTGLGLKEAKDAVEALERGGDISVGQTGEACEREVIALVANGAKIQAIRLYRERTGAGLKEAKDAVEAMAAKHGIVAPGGLGIGSLVVVLLFVLALA